jgi:3-methyladenine DNA glycosylase AlkD
MKRAKSAKQSARKSFVNDVPDALDWLKKNSSEAFRVGLARYGIPTDRAYGVSMSAVQMLGKEIGRNHALAEALWESGVYEARLLVAYVADPAQLTSAQMERWCRGFDNWAVVDTLCFKLFDQSPLVWKKVALWCRRKGEFQKRAGFVLIACLAAHAKRASDAVFRPMLPLIAEGATDERNFVKKGVSWALRMIGRHSLALHAESVALAERLIESGDTPARWVGKDVLKDLLKPAVKQKVASR